MYLVFRLCGKRNTYMDMKLMCGLVKILLVEREIYILCVDKCRQSTHLVNPEYT